MGKKGRQQVNKRHIAAKVNGLYAESRRFSERSQQFNKKKKKRKKQSLEQRKEELRSSLGPILNELLQLRKTQDQNGWANELFRKSRDMLTFLEYERSPIQFVAQYGGYTPNNSRKRPTFASESGRLPRPILEESQSHAPRTLEDYVSRANDYAQILRSNPENEEIYQKAFDLLVDWDKQNDKYPNGLFNKKSVVKKSRRLIRPFDRLILGTRLLRFYGPEDNPIFNFDTYDTQEGIQKLNEMKEATQEEHAIKEIQELIEKEYPWYVIMSGIRQNSEHVAPIEHTLIGKSKEGDDAIEYHGYSLQAEAIHKHVCEQSEYRKKFVSALVSYLRTEEFKQKTNIDGLHWMCVREKLDDLFLAQVQVRRKMHLQQAGKRIELYSIKLSPPYTRLVELEKRIPQSLIVRYGESLLNSPPSILRRRI